MKRFIIAVVVAALVFSGCGKKQEETAGELNIYTWVEYVPAQVIEDFQNETGIKVNYDNFSGNEEMYSKLQVTKGEQYDIVICTDYIIDVMRKQEGYLEVLDKAKIPNYINIDTAFQSKFDDPGNDYSIPYASGAAVLVYDTAKVPFEISSYRDLWNPELKNSVVLLDDERGMIGIALMANGESINETDPVKLEAAKQDLFALKPNVIGLDSNKPYEMIISGAAKAGFMLGSQVTAAMESVDTVTYAYPSEGLSISIDKIVMLKNAPNKDNAYRFINYILDGKVSAEISSKINYINCNLAAKEFLPQEYYDNKTVNIPSELVEKAQIYQDLGESAVEYSKIWTEFKSH